MYSSAVGARRMYQQSKGGPGDIYRENNFIIHNF